MDTPTPAAVPVLPLAYRSPDGATAVATEPVELAYSRIDALAAAQLAPLLKLLLVVAVLCGPCVATCFAVLARWPFAAELHLAVYAAILTAAILAGMRQNRLAAVFPALRSPTRAVLDLIAGVGLAILGLLPVVWQLSDWFGPYRSGPMLAVMGSPIAVAFTLLAGTTYRLLLQYHALATVMASIGRPKLARSLRVLGWTKFVVETVWLACCAFPLLVLAISPFLQQFRFAQTQDWLIVPAFGALIGVSVFAIVWIMMIVTHAAVAAAVRGRETTAADVSQTFAA